MLSDVRPLILTSMLLFGCGHTLDEGYRRMMLAPHIQCEPEQVAVTEREPNIFDVKGCERQGILQCSSHACANLTTLAQDRFEREHGCAKANSAVNEVSPLVFKVDGCEKSATYVCTMRDHLARCVAESAFVAGN
jgi:hypothetical protein